MKLTKLLIAFTSVFVLNAATSQKVAKLKIRKSFPKIQYFALPEIVSNTAHHNYYIDFSDLHGKKYSFGLGKFEISASGYLQGMVVKSDSNDYSVIVTQISNEKSKKNKEIVPAKYQVKNENGLNTTMEGVGYKFYYDQKFKITIIDNLDDKKEVFNDIISLESYSLFPADFGKVKGYPNAQILSSKFNAFLKAKKEQNQEDYFENVSQKQASKRAMKTGVKDVLNSKIGTKRTPIIISFTKFKTKDSRLAILDSLNFYSEEGVALLNEQKKTKIYKNGHAKDVFINFDNYYRLLSKINLEELSPILGDEVQIKAFKYGIKSDLFIAALFSSRYDEALSIYNEVKKEYDLQLANNVNSTFGTKVEICFLNVDKLYDVLIREKDLYEAHKEFYQFYK